MGIDMGYRKLIMTSNNEFIGKEIFDLYKRICLKQQGSKKYKRLLIHRDNLINYFVNQLDINGLNKIIIEDLKNVKKESEYNNKTNNLMSRWSYIKTIDKLTRVCEVNGIELVKVSPAYTSQTCSRCGSIHEESRLGDKYVCIDCGFEIDADFNASINIMRRGVYSLSNQKG